MQGAQFIVFAAPVFLLTTALDFVVGLRRGRNTYRLNDGINSVVIGILSQIVGLHAAIVVFGSYILAFDHLAPWQLPSDAWWVWLAGFLLYDLCYYGYHRCSHVIAIGWAGHVVHHQSEDYNLTTALRQPSTSWMLSWLFYLPMALLGFPPMVFGIVATIDLFYQYWVHTQQIGKLGWFDRWFCSPSNHRVHHAVNDRYLDKNFGGVLLVWDRLFGTYAAEEAAEPCVYGTRDPLRSWNPLWANLHNYVELARDSWRARRWSDKLRLWFKPPGWRPGDVALRWPKPPFDLSRRERYDPPMSRQTIALAVSMFIALIAATALFLWNAHEMHLGRQVAASCGLLAGVWLLGEVCTGRRKGA